MPGQTAYTVLPAVGLSGQILDDAFNLITSYPAGELISVGRACEVVAGVLRMCQTTGAALGNVVGVSCYIGAREPGQFAIGDMVPVLRRGKIFADWNGTTQVEFAVPNVNHSSTIATNRGVFTDAATSAGAGVEIAAAPSGCIEVRPTGMATVCLVELNLP